MKYIIDVPDADGQYDSEYEMVNMRIYYGSAIVDIPMDAEPYTEPDRKAIENEVWEYAWKIFLTPEDFGATMGDSYQEAKAKYEAWKKEKEKLRVGDEVIYHRNKYIVGYVGEDEVYHLVDQCWIRVVVQGDYQLTKTGRHFTEVTELLKKMRGEE